MSDPNVLLPAAAATLAVLVAIGSLARGRRTLPRWAFAAGLLLLAAECVFFAFDAQVRGSLAARQWRLVVLSLVPGVWLLFSLTYSRGLALSQLGRRAALLAAAIVLPLAFAVVARTHLIVVTAHDEGWVLRMAWPGLVLQGFVLAGSIAILMNLERTYRGSVGTMRWRIKFMLMGVGLLFIVRLYASSQALLFPAGLPFLPALLAGSLLVATAFFVRSLLRDPEFSLDVYPSQSLLENSLTALLAGVYLLLVGILAKVVAWLGGDSTFALKALFALVSLVFLALLLQSDHARLRLRRFVSRNFQRPIYDYRQIWKKFTERTAPCVEQGELCRELVRLLAEVLQALSVSIWLADDRRQSFALAASTALKSPVDGGPIDAESAAVLARFTAHPEPADFESDGAPWAAALRRWHPAEFPDKGGRRLAVPILGRGAVLGLFTIGDRVGGVEFSLQDHELLQCASEHAAAHLRNVQLAGKLLQARELEAFQAMAAFFVHDLKNAASTLNLMLQNLPDHYADPEFRADALRGIGKTVTHVNTLVGRLTQLRHELRIQPVADDFNAAIGEALSGLDTSPDFTVVREFGSVPRFPFDRTQLAKVVTNLVLNARDAMQGRGEVHLTTGSAGHQAVLTVRDQGCGMSPEFLSRSLFRPFQTTKKSGLGIGMFHSKTIIEAHGGRIAVASEPGRGTTFQVFLPLA